MGKQSIIIIAVILSAYLGYVIWINRSPQVKQPLADTHSIQAVISPTPTPSIAVQATVDKPKLPAKRLAPDGTYYLTERISVTTDSGINALRPGTEVHRLGDDSDMILVQCNDGTKLKVDSQQLTNDLDVATSVANAYNNSDRATAQLQARQAADASWIQQPIKPQISVAQTPPFTNNADHDARITSIRAQIEKHRAEIQRIIKEIENSPLKIRASVGNRLQPSINQNESQIRDLQYQLVALGVSNALLQ